MTNSEHEASKTKFKEALEKKKGNSLSRHEGKVSDSRSTLRASTGKKIKMFRRKSG